MIEIKNVTKTYVTREGEFKALDNVSLDIADGEIFGIIGESGAGKSTLVRCINMLEVPTSGSILIDGKDVTQYTGKALREFRSSVGMIFQNFSLFQQSTVLKNVMFPLEIRKEKDTHRALELLERVGIADKAKNYPSELSGGQQQRVAIARALVNQPKIMLCDEATSALDSRTTIQILDLLRSINRELGVTMVMITHSLDVAKRACSRIAVIDHGHIAEVGETANVFENPQSEATKLLISHYNGTIDDKEVL
jgi:D-methionine transport system ATP-binding protein